MVSHLYKCLIVDKEIRSWPVLSGEHPKEWKAANWSFWGAKTTFMVANALDGVPKSRNWRRSAVSSEFQNLGLCVCKHGPKAAKSRRKQPLPVDSTEPFDQHFRNRPMNTLKSFSFQKQGKTDKGHLQHQADWKMKSSKKKKEKKILTKAEFSC